MSALRSQRGGRQSGGDGFVFQSPARSVKPAVSPRPRDVGAAAINKLRPAVRPASASIREMPEPSDPKIFFRPYGGWFGPRVRNQSGTFARSTFRVGCIHEHHHR